MRFRNIIVASVLLIMIVFLAPGHSGILSKAIIPIPRAAAEAEAASSPPAVPDTAFQKEDHPYLSNLMSLVIGIAGSLIASLVFWYLTFKKDETALFFSDVIEESNSVKTDGYPRFRIKIANLGKADLLEISIKVKILVSLSKKNVTYLDVGNAGFIPVLKRPHNKKFSTSIFTIYPGELAFGEYQKDFYDPSLREKAARHQLSIRDIFDVYDDKVKIIVYAFGNDGFTGARRVFTKEYTKQDIRKGTYTKILEQNWKSKAAAAALISQITPPLANPEENEQINDPAAVDETDNV